VNVVLNLQEAVCLWIGCVNGLVPDVFAGLDCRWAVVEIPCCIKIEIDGVVAEGRQDALAVLFADGIGGSHVCREEAEDRVECNLIPDHLIRELRVG
jgi:hypothetical protein